NLCKNTLCNERVFSRKNATIVEIFFAATFDFVFLHIVRPFLLQTPYHTDQALLVWTAGFVFSPFVRLCLPFCFLDFSACISPPHPFTYPLYSKVILTQTCIFYFL